jgi:hypothetical protein
VLGLPPAISPAQVQGAVTTVPLWLYTLAIVSLALACVAALIVIFDELVGHPQQMWIMNIVWPVTMLWAGPLGFLAYFTVGRMSTRRAVESAKARGDTPPSKRRPFWQSVAVGATHCGAGCSLADLVVEWAVLAFPLSLFGSDVAGAWAIDYVAAFALGIAFQYFTIAPMRGASLGEGLLAAVKADTLSLSAWQLGMYGWMALALFVFFSRAALPKTEPTFWFMMQIAMAAGFLTSYPVNWWLLRRGLKEVM